jgi:hypothetical protein
MRVDLVARSALLPSAVRVAAGVASSLALEPDLDRWRCRKCGFEPNVMDRPPRPRSERLIDRPMLVRAASGEPRRVGVSAGR